MKLSGLHIFGKTTSLFKKYIRNHHFYCISYIIFLFSLRKVNDFSLMQLSLHENEKKSLIKIMKFLKNRVS